MNDFDPDRSNEQEPKAPVLPYRALSDERPSLIREVVQGMVAAITVLLVAMIASALARAASFSLVVMGSAVALIVLNALWLRLNDKKRGVMIGLWLGLLIALLVGGWWTALVVMRGLGM